MAIYNIVAYIMTSIIAIYMALIVAYIMTCKKPCIWLMDSLRPV
jgi:hypothetical protein